MPLLQIQVADAIDRAWSRGPWAPGLRSLREIAVGIDAGLWFQSQETRAYHGEIFRCMTFGEEPVAMRVDNIRSFLTTPKALKFLTVRGDSGDFIKNAQLTLMGRAGKSLEKLIEYPGHQQNWGSPPVSHGLGIYKLNYHHRSNGSISASGTLEFSTEKDNSVSLIPESLPNGLVLPRRYKRLLYHFAEGVLASLSSHPTIHNDFRRGLMPTMFDSPHLLSASLALSTASFESRGITEVEGTSTSRIMEHLQSSGLPLLRSALAQGQQSEILIATCLIWCLADVFSGQQGMFRWPIHLQGIKALLHGRNDYQRFARGDTALRSAMKHLFMLYRSLETLPHVPTITSGKTNVIIATDSAYKPQIDGFLGYSEELLDILQQINATAPRSGLEDPPADADTLLGKLNAMIRRDVKSPPAVSISSLSSQSGRDFILCNQVFQQATLIQLYRQLYGLPSSSEPIQAAVQTINGMISNMTQGEPCNTWVAMAMPLFTVGCEAYKEEQKTFILDKIHKLEICIGSLHVKVIEQALKDIWKIREDCNDYDGNLCASYLLALVADARPIKVN
ncbi:C6 finger domain protein [Fusarium beomiforme]|uniref:C6 finger domain protein n=1 Tax=Fusarium beomiforme TaxID=44412 RepID=A0A9P5AQF2_9HYPO|nr:C6 finger domain protein [Fusarium beomiforme]